MYDVYYTFVRFKTKDARSLRLALCSTSSLIVFFSYYYFSSGDTDDFNHNVKKKKKTHCVHAGNIIHDHFNVAFNQESPTRLRN